MLNNITVLDVKIGSFWLQKRSPTQMSNTKLAYTPTLTERSSLTTGLHFCTLKSINCRTIVLCKSFLHKCLLLSPSTSNFQLQNHPSRHSLLLSLSLYPTVCIIQSTPLTPTQAAAVPVAAMPLSMEVVLLPLVPGATLFTAE